MKQIKPDERIETERGKRVGRFRCSSDFVLHCWPAMKELMRHCVPIRCEFKSDLGIYEYGALSEEFEEIAYGELVPEYIAEFKASGDDDKVEFLGWKKVGNSSDWHGDFRLAFVFRGE